jgi:hypothetical protein
MRHPFTLFRAKKAFCPSAIMGILPEVPIPPGGMRLWNMKQ